MNTVINDNIINNNNLVICYSVFFKRHCSKHINDQWEKMRMKMGILNLSKAPQVTKTDIEDAQNQRNLVTVHSLMPTLN